jgi:hypothetical protein
VSCTCYVGVALDWYTRAKLAESFDDSVKIDSAMHEFHHLTCKYKLMHALSNK